MLDLNSEAFDMVLVQACGLMCGIIGHWAVYSHLISPACLERRRARDRWETTASIFLWIMKRVKRNRYSVAAFQRWFVKTWKYADDRSKHLCSGELWSCAHTSRRHFWCIVCSCGYVMSEYSIFSLVCESAWSRVVMLAGVCELGSGVACCILISCSCMCPLLKACLLYRRIRGLLCCDKTLLAQKHTWNGESL